jgi:hypothetical protein
MCKAILCYIGIYDTGEWPKDLNRVTVIALKKKPKAANCSDYRSTAQAAKIVAKIRNKRLEKKTDDVLGGDQAMTDVLGEDGRHYVTDTSVGRGN